ncbi:hypothetical protein BASA81_008349 [Batrachochytrium salamandrivorans]|nr:hypothetical protein BASA81_008349 [Batrachochytrium salamandrivorans]
MSASKFEASATTACHANNCLSSHEQRLPNHFKMMWRLLLLVLGLLMGSAWAGIASMLAGSSIGESGFWSHFPTVFSMVRGRVPSAACRQELGRFQPYVDNGKIKGLLTDTERSNRAVCKLLSKSCVQEIGSVLADMAGKETVKRQLKDQFGDEADETKDEFKLPFMFGRYYDNACAGPKVTEL